MSEKFTSTQTIFRFLELTQDHENEVEDKGHMTDRICITQGIYLQGIKPPGLLFTEK